MTTDPELQAHFEARARTAHHWQSHARDFVCSANRLAAWYIGIIEKTATPPHDEAWHSSFQPMMLLLAVAGENLVKALLVAQGMDPVPSGALDSKLQTHNVEALWIRAGLSMTAEEQHLLQRMRDFVESGKYPIGQTAEKGHGATHFAHPFDLDKTYELLQKLDDEVCKNTSPHLRSVVLRSLCAPSRPELM